MTTAPWVDVPGEVLDILRLWRNPAWCFRRREVITFVGVAPTGARRAGCRPLPSVAFCSPSVTFVAREDLR